MRIRRWRGFRPFVEPLDGRWLPTGFTPSQIVDAYGLGGIVFHSSTGASIAADGTGQTIAIVDEYHDANLQASLNVFDVQYGLPSLTVNVIDQAGNQSDSGWATEETLDVEWAHAIAPGAKITVVESSPGTTSSQEFSNLMNAVKTASQVPGVSVVSMSWGYTESSGESSSDSTFLASGITFIAASGDSGAIQWPSTAPGVLSVGGTMLTLSGTGGYGSETGWNNSGGGVSAFETEPSFQKVVQSTGNRSTPDVSFDGNPQSGVSIYVILPGASADQGKWGVVGGTSVGAPAWAGIMAIVNQGRGEAGLASLTGATQTLPTIYALPPSDFNKSPISAGGSASNMTITTANYNTQAGLGSPAGAVFIDAMVGSTTSAPTPSPSPTSSPGTPPGLRPSPPPIPIFGPSPTPPPVIGPPPAPLPSPTPSPTPPPAPPPQPAPGSVLPAPRRRHVHIAKPKVHHPRIRHPLFGKANRHVKDPLPSTHRHHRAL